MPPWILLPAGVVEPDQLPVPCRLRRRGERRGAVVLANAFIHAESHAHDHANRLTVGHSVEHALQLRHANELNHGRRLGVAVADDVRHEYAIANGFADAVWHEIPDLVRHHERFCNRDHHAHGHALTVNHCILHAHAHGIQDGYIESRRQRLGLPQPNRQSDFEQHAVSLPNIHADANSLLDGHVFKDALAVFIWDHLAHTLGFAFSDSIPNSYALCVFDGAIADAVNDEDAIEDDVALRNCLLNLICHRGRLGVNHGLESVDADDDAIPDIV